MLSCYFILCYINKRPCKICSYWSIKKHAHTQTLYVCVFVCVIYNISVCSFLNIETFSKQVPLICKYFLCTSIHLMLFLCKYFPYKWFWGISFSVANYITISRKRQILIYSDWSIYSENINLNEFMEHSSLFPPGLCLISYYKGCLYTCLGVPHVCCVSYIGIKGQCKTMFDNICIMYFSASLSKNHSQNCFWIKTLQGKRIKSLAANWSEFFQKQKCERTRTDKKSCVV